VTTNDERDLYERLDRALETIAPHPAPIDEAIRRGRVSRRRRRRAAVAGAAAGVAAGAGLVAGLVVLLPAHGYTTSGEASGSGAYTVTVQTRSPHAPAGEIAAGTLDGQAWQITAKKPGTDGAAPGMQLIVASGPAAGPAGMSAAGSPLAANGADPVAWQEYGMGNSTAQGQLGAVRADVSYVTVRLSNGTVLTLQPVTVYGARAVAFVAPLGATILDATAYSRHGEIATAIPFSYPGQRASFVDGIASFITWLKPGQHGLDRASGRLGSGTFDGHTWSATVYLGPWGICFEVAGGAPMVSYCTPATSALGTHLLFWTGVDPNVAGGSAAASVARVVVHRVDGVTVEVRPVTIGQQKFFVFPMRDDDRDPLGWKAYDSSGRLVASSAS
jgi:hypothetical protein